jgi:histidyl-tRNA synthetase
MPKTKNQNSNQDKFLREVRGMHDILPADQPYWDAVRRAAASIASFYNFGLIETPVLEYAKLYEKGTGEETDIVQKEMYTLRTKGGDVLALRPEYTPGIMRAFTEHGLNRLGLPQKLYHFGPVFRHENPQAGRYRQFYQVGFEILGGPNDPVYDAQAILIAWRLLQEVKLKGIRLKLNSVGCRVCRPLYKKQLQNYYRPHEKKLCADCQKRLKTNPLRLLDCKNKECQEFKESVPNILDKLCVSCSHHLKTVLEYLDEAKIDYALEPKMVRGLDYYSKTVFEMYADQAEHLGALPAGGRYDYLMEMLGGRSTPAVGFACGVERVIEAMKLQEVKPAVKPVKKVFVVHVGDLAKKKAFKLVEELRAAGIPAFEALSKDSLKAQLKSADREHVPLAVILGQKEVYEESVIIRDLRSGLQEAFPAAKMAEELKKRLRE